MVNVSKTCLHNFLYAYIPALPSDFCEIFRSDSIFFVRYFVWNFTIESIKSDKVLVWMFKELVVVSCSFTIGSSVCSCGVGIMIQQTKKYIWASDFFPHCLHSLKIRNCKKYYLLNGGGERFLGLGIDVVICN